MGDPGAFRSHLRLVWCLARDGLSAPSSISPSFPPVDPALHEAAVVDGASRLQRIRYIDIPGLLPTAMVLLVLSTGRVLGSRL